MTPTSSHATPDCLSPDREREAVPAGAEPLPFAWEELVPLLVHPVKVSCIEAIRCIGRPMSATDLREVFDEEFELSLISYHLVSLAKLKILRKTKERQVRGATEKFYFLR
jgi:hypothetical protein